jgi:hypothetical protein
MINLVVVVFGCVGILMSWRLICWVVRIKWLSWGFFWEILMLFDPLMRRAVTLCHGRGGNLILIIMWCEPLDHAVKQPIQLEKPSKSGLIGMWYKDNLYLGASTIENGNPHPTNIDSQMRSIRMMSWSQLFFNKSFFNSLENQGREIIPPTHNKCDKQDVLLIWIV